MSDFEQGAGARSDEALEQLLSRASPRPIPSAADEAAVRNAVRAEWRSVSGQRRARRRIAGFAIAATVLLAVFLVPGLLRQPVVDSVQVATIEKELGSIYLLAETAELRETEALSRVFAGQTIVTGDEAGMALAWGEGGSLRIDANTRVRFVDNSTVYLAAGRLYFDSRPAAMPAGEPGSRASAFLITSDRGQVSHRGTQFMTRISDGNLTVSVREGQVTVNGEHRGYVASSGEQVTVTEQGTIGVLNISRSGETWDWIRRTSPAADVDGKSLHEFLLWVCRETGLDYRYEGGAEKTARYDAILVGQIDTEPLEALKSRLATADLKARIVEGVIIVTDQ